MFTVKMFIPGPDTDIVIQGPRTAVLRAVARLAGLEDDRSVETRDSTLDDGTRVVVDRQRAPGCPEMLAEVIPHAQPALHRPPPSWERSVESPRMARSVPAELTTLPYVVHPLLRPSGSERGPEYATGYLTPGDEAGPRWIEDQLERVRNALPVGWVAHWLATDPGDTRIVVSRDPSATDPVVQQIADLEEIEPLSGWEDRAVERARRAGIIPGDDWAVLDIREGTSYGLILSRHASEADARTACAAVVEHQLGSPRNVYTRNAIPHLMWTTARVAGEVGERVQYR